MGPINWGNIQQIETRNYICGYCGRDIASNRGITGSYSIDDGPRRGVSRTAYIYICHRCGGSTFFDHSRQVPGPLYGRDVDSLPENIRLLYSEARNCMSVGASTASVLCCRKLLMNIAVAKGAKEDQKFVQYVEYLTDHGYVPPDGKEWVDHIRKMGNEATHEIAIVDFNKAGELLTFMEMILIFIFEFPAIMKGKA